MQTKNTPTHTRKHLPKHGPQKNVTSYIARVNTREKTCISGLTWLRVRREGTSLDGQADTDQYSLILDFNLADFFLLDQTVFFRRIQSCTALDVETFRYVAPMATTNQCHSFSLTV